MRHAFLHHPRHREKSGPISHRHGSVSELYGRSTVIRSPPVNRPTPHFMSSWKCPAHIRSAICMLRCFSRTTTMACSNVRSRRFCAGSDRLREMLLLVLFLSAVPGSARAQLVEQDVFITPSYDVECTFAQSGGPELSCDRFGERHLRLVLGPTGHAHILTVSSAEGCCSTEKVLEPGMTWSKGPFVCRYARNDLTCERERHGFRIGKKVVVAY